MKSHARRGHAGFSMVELLVTIVIASIAFAAMVPLFVQAQKQTSSDNMRNVTMQVAQEKIEQVRLLDYDQVTQANLDDETFADEQFGNAYTYTGGGGGTRTLTLAYAVSLVPATINGTPTPAGREKYKKVDVQVSWTGQPLPVRPALLSTLVYRQYAGAQLRRLDIGPVSIFEVVSGTYTITSGPVVLDAYIAPEDILGMNADLGDPSVPSIRRRMGYVRFSVTNPNGVETATSSVYTYVTGEPGHYRFTWDNSAAPDGIYTFEALAVSGSQQQGTAASVAYKVAGVRPPAPTGLAVAAGDRSLALMWDAVAIGDLDHYELYRSLDGVTYSPLAVDLPVPGYTDSGLTNGTTYYYQVRCVDNDLNASLFSAPVSGVPIKVVDNKPPTTPGSFTVAKVAGTPTIRLTWTASADASGFVEYYVERSPDGVTWTQILAGFPHLEFLDVDAGWNTLWYYHVRAADPALNFSDYTAALSARTDPIPFRTLTVSNNRGLDVYVWVQNVSTGRWYSLNGTSYATKPASGQRVKKAKSETWVNLPAGIYNVTNGEGFPPQAVELTYGNGAMEI
jgi:prepilin-type N-terminal cleavage/methylation domain-containing protein